MAEYYFLATALPPLMIGKKPEVSFDELRELLRANLTAADWVQFTDLLRLIDLSNIRSLWLKGPFDERGNFEPQEMEDALLEKEGLDEYINVYLDRYASNEDRLRYFPSLYSSLFLAMENKYVNPTSFLHKYYRMEREIRLMLTALRAKRFGRDIVRELQFEDPSDSLVAEILAQKDAAEYSPPIDRQVLKSLFVRCADDPKELFRALLEYRFERLEEMEENEPFTIDAILSYAARLLLVESWEQLDVIEGKKIMNLLQ